MIEVYDADKTFKDHTVLRDINFKVKKGELVCVIGKSGVGKSTLLHLLIGAEKCDRGLVKVKDKNLKTLSRHNMQEYRRGVGIIFQDFKLIKNKTVYENIAFALEATEEKQDNIKTRVNEALEVVGLTHKKDSLPSVLSGGEQQRTAIARAIIHAPDLIFADEPTGNLDPENTLAIANLLQKLNKEQGVTVFITTHDPALVAEISPRLLVIEDGKLTKDLPSGTIFPNYYQ